MSVIDELIASLRLLPGVGVKTAHRMAFTLLQHDRDAARRLAAALISAAEAVRHCELCHILTEHTLCDICSCDSRDISALCVVEMPADVVMIEKTATYSGLYFVLMGRFSPLDGLGPHDLNVQGLLSRVHTGRIKEVILATNHNNEGDATAHHLTSLLKHYGIKVSRIARGVPAGSELEYVDLGTLAQAIADRRRCD